MRILVEPGTHDCLNFGDLAMLQVTLSRLEELWPEGHFLVTTRRPDRLRNHCPSVEPIPPRDDAAPSRRRVGSLFERIGALSRLGRPASCPRSPPPRPDEPASPLTAMDAVVVSGAGGFNDGCVRHSLRILARLEAAAQLGRVTALFSQGIGPLTDRALLLRMSEVLPMVDLLTLREARIAPSLLTALGVPTDRMLVTGDDAVEWAYRERRAEPGQRLGLNVRIAGYAETEQGLLRRLQAIVPDLSRRLGAEILPLPISLRPGESDAVSLRQVLAAHPCSAPPPPAGPREVIRQVGACRTVLTGSYHAAVFALAQGIPAVCLAASRYYRDKFLGLARQFGDGCTLVALDDPRFERTVSDAVEHAWHVAPRPRPQLLASARRQVEAGRGAYTRFHEVAAARRPSTRSAAANPAGGPRGW